MTSPGTSIVSIDRGNSLQSVPGGWASYERSFYVNLYQQHLQTSTVE